MKTRISYNPFARLDPVRHYNEREIRRYVSRSLAIAIGLVALLFFCARTFGQNVEYGEPAEFKGLTTYYIDTEGNTKARNKMIEMIRKDLPSLKLVESMADAQMKLGYTGKVQDVIVGGQVIGSTAIVDRDALETGTGMAFLAARGKDRSAPRIILSFSSRQDGKFEKPPYEKFTKEFIKTYKKANGLK